MNVLGIVVLKRCLHIGLLCVTFLCDLSAADSELVEVQFSKLLEKLRSAELSSPAKPLLLDLGVAFAPLLSGDSLTSLFNLISPLLDVRRTVWRGRGSMSFS